MSDTVTAARLDAAFADAGVTGWLHAVDIDSGAQVGAGADQPVCTASVHKLCVLVTLHELAAAGNWTSPSGSSARRPAARPGPPGSRPCSTRSCCPCATPRS